MTFSELRWPKARRTRLQSVLDNLDRGIQWAKLVEQIAPHYPKPGSGRQPVPLETMIRIHVSACVLGANDRQAEEFLVDCPALCTFCRLDDTGPRPPDAETIGGFRRRLERADLDAHIKNRVELDLNKHAARVIPGKVSEPQWVGPPVVLDHERVFSCGASRTPASPGHSADDA